MNVDLEALLEAYQAHREKRQSKSRWMIFESRVDDAAEKYSVSKESLIAAVRARYPLWAKAQQKKSTLPPKA